MEAEDIERALGKARKVSKAILFIFAVVGLVCVSLAALLICSAVSSLAEGGPTGPLLYFPGILEWIVFAVACATCASAALLVTRGETVFTETIRRRFTVSAVLVWIYAIIDCAWFPAVEKVGELLGGGAFTFAVAQHGLDMGFNFNVGAVFAAGALTLIASLVHYASLLQQQTDELW